jgi:hypothetical protein
MACLWGWDVRQYIARMHCQYCRLGTFALKLSSHVPQHLIQSRFRRRVCPESVITSNVRCCYILVVSVCAVWNRNGDRNVPILEVTEVRRRSRIAGDKDYGPDRYLCCKELLGSDDGPNCIGAEVVFEVCEGASSVWSQDWVVFGNRACEDVHLGCPLFSQPCKHVVESHGDRMLDAIRLDTSKLPR